MYSVLGDDDVDRHLSIGIAIDKMRDALAESAAGTLIAPPRFRFEAGAGSLVFTVGAATGPESAIGFRVYDTFGAGTSRPQIVAVFDYGDGALRGLVLGHRIGLLRTAALGGVAIDHLARVDAARLGVIGAGAQAREQVCAAASVRPLREVRLFSRTASRASVLAEDLEQTLEIPVQVVSDARHAVEDVDIVVCATDSPRPVLEAAWIGPGTHVTTIGPKRRDGHELPVEVAARAACVVTDSPAQARATAGGFFLDDDVPLLDLAGIARGSVPGRTADDDVTLFCSVGLSGTEVVLANELLRRARSDAKD